MRFITTIALAILSLAPLTSLAAQTEQTVLVGARVRITLPDTMRVGDEPALDRPLVVVGKLVAISDSTLMIHNEASANDVTLARARVQRLEVGTGSDRAKTTRTGGVVGLVFGAVLGYVAGEDCSSNDFICFPREETALGGALLGAALGAGIGFLVGGESWHDAALPARVGFVPTGSRSMVITSTLRF